MKLLGIVAVVVRLDGVTEVVVFVVMPVAARVVGPRHAVVVRVGVLVHVLMHMEVRMLMHVHRPVGMRVFMRMRMGVRVFVQVLVGVAATHGPLPFQPQSGPSGPPAQGRPPTGAVRR